MTEKFKVQFLEDAAEFIEALDKKAREKIIYNVRKAQITSDRDLFKKLNNEIWEFRTLYQGLQYRLLAFWDKTDSEETLVISTNAFVKKQSKVPKNEIQKAKKIRLNYFEEKERLKK